MLTEQERAALEDIRPLASKMHPEANLALVVGALERLTAQSKKLRESIASATGGRNPQDHNVLATIIAITMGHEAGDFDAKRAMHLVSSAVWGKEPSAEVPAFEINERALCEAFQGLMLRNHIVSVSSVDPDTIDGDEPMYCDEDRAMFCVDTVDQVSGTLEEHGYQDSLLDAVEALKGGT